MSVSMFYLFAIFVVIIVCSDGAVTGTMANSYDTIVIGLGSSGATAASTLAKAGKRVLALEAQDRIGGRVKTVPFGEGVVEVGAEWIHGQYPSRVYDLVIQNNISVIPQDISLEVYNSDGTLGNRNLINELVEYSLNVVDDSPETPEPLGEFIIKKLNDYMKKNHEAEYNDKDFMARLFEFLDLIVGNYEASNDWNDVSTFTKYKELDGHQHVSWHKYGYKTFFDMLLNRYNNGPGLPTLDIKLSTEVTQIDSTLDSQNKVVVTTKDGDVYMADNVIVTVSLGVLKERYTTLFKPSLPEDKVKAITNMAIGLMDKVILSFSEPWWPKNASFFGFMWRGEEKSSLPKDDFWTTKIWGVSTPMGSSNALTLWTNGDVAKLVETLPEDLVRRKCMELLRRFMGRNISIPEPTGMIRSTWFSNQFTRGSYTFDNHAVAADPLIREKLARPLLDAAGEPRVLFAGEATHNIYFSTVHGASDSGYREAMRLLKIASKL